MKQKLFYFLLMFLSFLSLSKLHAQTMQAGDIAFLGMDIDGNDTFSFIALTDLPAGEIVFFTDEGWENNGTWAVLGEGHLSWTIPAGVTTGTIVTIVKNGTNNYSITPASTIVESDTSFALSIAGDQVLAYQSSGNVVKSSSPIFIAGMHMDYNSTKFNPITKWSTEVNGGSAESTLPAGLTNGTNAISLLTSSPEYDNAKYNGTLTGSVATILASINDPINWIFDNSTPYDLSASAYPTPNITSAPTCTMTASISSQTNVGCTGDTTGSLSVTPAAGTSPYTYLWNDSGAQTTATATGLAAGTYEVTVTDALGCTATASATITQPTTALSASAVATNESCTGSNDGIVDLTVTGGTAPYTYSWNSGDSSEDLTLKSVGTYSVTVTDANGCITTASAIIGTAVFPSPDIHVNNILCNGESTGTVRASAVLFLQDFDDGEGSFQASTTNVSGISGLSYDYTSGGRLAFRSDFQRPGFSGKIASLDNPGGGGVNRLTQVVDMSQYVSDTDLKLDFWWYDHGDESDSEDVVEIRGSDSDPWITIYSFGTNSNNGQWSYAAFDLDDLLSTNGQTLSSTFAIRFSQTDNFPINTDGISIDDLAIFRENDVYSFSWSNGNTTSTQATTGSFYYSYIDLLSAGTYNVTVNNLNGCIANASATITEPTAISISSTKTNVSCNGGNDGAVDLTVTGGTAPYTFAWNNSETTEDLSGLVAATYSVTVTDANGCTATASIDVEEPAILTANAVATHVSCNGGNDGAVDLTVVGGNPPYTFVWNNTATTEDLLGLTAATYSVTVTDAKGCTATTSVDVEEPTILVANGVATDATCVGNDGAVDLTVVGGNPPYTFAWNNTATTEDLSGLTAATYSVTVTDSKGCIATETVVVGGPPAIIASAVATHVSCNGGSNGTVDLTVSGGVAPYTFVWNNTATTEDLSGLTAATYSVTVTDSNGCTTTTSVDVEEPAILMANAVATNVSCNGGNDGSVDLTVTGGNPPYTYAWNNTATTEDLSGLTAATYSVTVTDAKGCTTTTSVDVFEPIILEANGQVTNSTCNGGNDGAVDLTVIGGNPPYVFAWNNTATTEDLSGLTAGTYSVTVTDSKGCTASKSFDVFEPAILMASGVATNVSCNGGSNGTVDLTVVGGTAPYTFAWSNTATTEDMTGLVAGTYNVTVTDAKGCTTTTSVEVTEPAILIASGVATNVSCNGGNDGAVDLTVTGGNPPYTYAWNNSATTEDLSGLIAATYSVTVTDAKGCTTTTSVDVFEPAVLSANGIATNVSCNGGNDGAVDLTVVGGNPPYTYAWSNTATTEDLSGLTAGTYNVTVTDAKGCTTTTSVEVTEPTVLMASGVATNVSCNGGSNGTVDLTVVGGTSPYTFAWSNTATTEDMTGLTAGTYNVTVTDANGCTATTSVEVTEPAVLVASGVATNVSCNGGSNGTIDLTVVGGTSPYTFAWSNTATTEDMTGLTAGTYNVTVTDTNGCTATTSVEVTEPAVLVASGVATNVSCNGGSNGTIDLTVVGGTAPYTFAWSNTATTEDMTGLTAGTYNVTVTDANGCTATTSVEVTEPAVLVVSGVATNVSCNGGSNGTIDLTVVGGTAPYTFAWSNTATTEDMTGLTAGTYNVTVTDANGCTATTSVEVTEPAVLVASGVATNVSCNGGADGTIDLTVVGGTAPYTFAWSNTATTEDMTGLTAGTYNVTVTDANGCTATTSVEVTEPAVLVASGVATNVSCNGGADGTIDLTVVGGTAPYTFAWSNTASTEDMTGLTAGTYNVTVTDANGCTATTSVEVTEPLLLVAITGVNDNVSCNGGADGAAIAAGFGGTAPYTYLWDGGVTTEEITGLAAGTYNVTVTDANGCTANGTVTITEPAVLMASTTVDANVSCNGGTDGAVTVTATGGTAPYTYAWTNSATTASVTGLAAGTYDVVVTDANGCTANASVTVTEPTILMASAIVDANVSCNSGADGTATVTATGGTAPYTYAWDTTDTTASVTGLAAGTYNVIVTDANGCTASASVTITEPTLLEASAMVDMNVSCNGGADGMATVTAMGGTMPYTYLWDDTAASTTAMVDTFMAGTYTVIVTDANGCTASATVTITEPDVLTASTMVDNDVYCFGGATGTVTINLTGGTSPFEYTINGTTYSGVPDAMLMVSGLPSGTYPVFITDANGCTTTTSVTLAEPALLEATATEDMPATCVENTDGIATVTAMGGTMPYTYVWDNTEVTATATMLSVGVHTVTITDANGCITTATVTVSFDDTFDPVPDVANLPDITAECMITASDVPVPTATDNCVGTIMVTNDASFPITAQGTTVITWTYTDVNGNTTTQTQNVILDDVTAPVADVTNLPDITMQCQVLTTDIPVPTATDNCVGMLTATTNDPLLYTATGSYVITWMYDDGNGNTTTQTQNIIVTDSVIDAVTFTDGTFVYNTAAQGITVANMPTGASVAYSISPDTGLNNMAVDAGTYTVTAVVTPAANAPNCDPITLTATLTIDKAPQDIIFNALPVKQLEVDPDFQLTATTTSGLPVYYTYTYTAANPPATVTDAGWVDMLTSGFVDITAHQDGDSNYLPATSVMQVLEITSSDSSVHTMTIGGQVYDAPTGPVYYLMDCGDGDDSVLVSIMTEANAIVTPSHEFYIDTPQPGIYHQTVTVTSQDGTTVNTFVVTVERMFNFFDIVEQKFDNLLLANNNPSTNGGYSFVAYEWYKNGVFVGDGQYFSEGPTNNDLLDPTAEYHLKLTTSQGDVLQTCNGSIVLEHSYRLSVTPNPVKYGKEITVTVDFPADEVENMQIDIYDLFGKKVYTTYTSQRISTIRLSESIQPATYLVRCTTDVRSKTFKIIVQ